MTAATSQQQMVRRVRRQWRAGMIMIGRHRHRRGASRHPARPDAEPWRPAMDHHPLRADRAATIATGGRLADVFGRQTQIHCRGRAFRPRLAPLRRLGWPAHAAVRPGAGGARQYSDGAAAALVATEAFGPTHAAGRWVSTAPLAVGAGVRSHHLRRAGAARWLALGLLREPPAGRGDPPDAACGRPATASPRGGTFRPMHSLLLAVALGPLVLGLQQSHVWGLERAPDASNDHGRRGSAGAVHHRAAARGRAAGGYASIRRPQFAADGIVLFCAQCALVGQSAFGAIYLQRICTSRRFSPASPCCCFCCP